MDYRKMTAKGIVLHMLAYGVITKEQAAKYFPKLDEGKDERIKSCIEICLIDVDEQKFINFNTNLKECLDWLNEKVEQKPQDKSVLKTAYKSEFKVGDWIVNNTSKDIFLIKCINAGYYTLENVNGKVYTCCLPPIEDNNHLWSIVDAKAGDILVSYSGKPFIFNGEFDDLNVGSYCGINLRDNFITNASQCAWTNNRDIKPATKKQSNLLFQKMNKAGYEWDAKKKELNKLK